jgi:hypothetical protein
MLLAEILLQKGFKEIFPVLYLCYLNKGFEKKMNNPTAASCGVSKRGRIASVAWL